MKVIKIAQPVDVMQIYAQEKSLPTIFDISRRSVTDYIQEMYASADFVAGDDYIDVSTNQKLIKIDAFRRLLASKHLGYLKVI